MTLAEIVRLEPGLYPDLPEEVYHSDPAKEPSLSGSLAKLFIEHSPWHVWIGHPRLNPQWKLDPGKLNTDVGTICHKLLFGVGKPYEVLDYADFKSNAAKNARDACYRKGIVPILQHKFAPLPGMIESCHAQIKGTEHEDAFSAGGRAEVTFIVEDHGAWLRCRTDWLPHAVMSGGHVKVYDYKSTEKSANPNNWQKILFDKHMDMQAAMNERCIRATVEGIKSFEFIYIVQEWKYPHAISFVALGGEALTDAHTAIAAAIETWDACTKARAWPGYPRRTVRVDPANWRKSALVLRKMELYDLIAKLQEPDEKVDPTTGEVLQTVGPVDVFGLPPAPKGSIAYAGDDAHARLAAQQARDDAEWDAADPAAGERPATALVKTDPTPAADDGVALAGGKFMLDPAPPPDIKTRPVLREAEVPEGDEDGEL